MRIPLAYWCPPRPGKPVAKGRQDMRIEELGNVANAGSEHADPGSLDAGDAGQESAGRESAGGRSAGGRSAGATSAAGRCSRGPAALLWPWARCGWPASTRCCRSAPRSRPRRCRTSSSTSARSSRARERSTTAVETSRLSFRRSTRCSSPPRSAAPLPWPISRTSATPWRLSRAPTSSRRPGCSRSSHMGSPTSTGCRAG